MPKWKTLGSGSYNHVFYDETNGSVLKVPKQSKDGSAEWDSADRSIRLWNELNGTIEPAAYKTPVKPKGWELLEGWVCPFIEGTSASDKELSFAVIDVYNQTGRIVVDAPSPKNFIKTESGDLVCVDVGMALQLDPRDEYVAHGRQIRRKSVTSLDVWDELKHDFDSYFIKAFRSHPYTTNTIKALLFLKENRPDLHDLNLLKGNTSLINKLAGAYDASKKIPNTIFGKRREQRIKNNQVIRSEALNLIDSAVLEEVDLARALIFLEYTPIDSPCMGSALQTAKTELGSSRIDEEQSTLSTTIDDEPITPPLVEVTSGPDAHKAAALEKAQEDCIKELNQFLPSPGERADRGGSVWFFPLFQPLIPHDEAHELIHKINRASSMEHLGEVLGEALEKHGKSGSCFRNPVADSLYSCLSRINSPASSPMVMS